MKKVTLLAALLMLTACSGGGDKRPLDTVSYVDIEQYLGRWFEIARIDHSFQRGCIDSEANYSMREDGDIRVINKCYDTRKSELKESTGRAWIKDTESNSKLKVQFFLHGLKLGFLSGDYWILELDEGYNHAIVGSPNRDYLWILSRTPTMDDTTYDTMIKKIEDLNFDSSRLLKNVPLGT